MLNRGAEQ